MAIWERLTAFLLRLIDTYDAPGLALLVLVEEAGVPSPVPSDVLMLVAGARAAQGRMNLFTVIALAELATIVGASLLYWLAARGGRPMLQKYGRFLRVSMAKLDEVEGQINRGGWVAIAIGRLVPGLRVVTAIAAGALGVPYRVFLPGMALGGLAYLTVFALLGYFVGPGALALIEAIHLPIRASVTLGLFLIVGVSLGLIYREARRREEIPDRPVRGWRQVETALLAGMLATFEMVAAIDILLYALGGLGQLPAQAAMVRFLTRTAARYAEGSPPALVGLALLLLLALGLGWAVLYAQVAADRLPGPPWRRGLVFAILPLAASVGVIMPLLGAGPLGLDLGVGLVPLAGEVVRNALFGIGLGSSYALLRAARDEAPWPIDPTRRPSAP